MQISLKSSPNGRVNNNFGNTVIVKKTQLVIFFISSIKQIRTHNKQIIYWFLFSSPKQGMDCWQVKARYRKSNYRKSESMYSICSFLKMPLACFITKPNKSKKITRYLENKKFKLHQHAQQNSSCSHHAGTGQ